MILPPVTADLRNAAEHASSQRDGDVASFVASGRMSRQKETGYGCRSLVETAMGRAVRDYYQSAAAWVDLQ